jgi:hypothetical protein
MFENLGMLLGGDMGGLAGMFSGVTGNPLEMLIRVSQDPVMREAFLNRAASSPISPSVFSMPGGMPTGPAGQQPMPVTPWMTPPQSQPMPVTPGMTAPTATALPVLPPAQDPQSPYFEFGVSPDVAAQMNTNLPTSAEYAQATGQATPQPQLGQLLAGAQSAMKDNRKEQPQQPQRVVSAGGGAHGSVNRNAPPNYLPTSQTAGVDPLEFRRRATLAALLAGGVR